MTSQWKNLFLRVKALINVLASVSESTSLQKHIDVILQELPQDYRPGISVI